MGNLPLGPGPSAFAVGVCRGFCEKESTFGHERQRSDGHAATVAGGPTGVARRRRRPIECSIGCSIACSAGCPPTRSLQCSDDTLGQFHDVPVLFDGTVDGTVDGVLDGAVEGTVDGTFDGTVDVTSNGMFDGMFDETVDGKVDGMFDGTVDVTWDRTVDWTFDGTVEGMLDGTVERTYDGTFGGAFDGNIRWNARRDTCATTSFGKLSVPWSKMSGSQGIPCILVMAYIVMAVVEDVGVARHTLHFNHRARCWSHRVSCPFCIMYAICHVMYPICYIM